MPYKHSCQVRFGLLYWSLKGFAYCIENKLSVRDLCTGTGFIPDYTTLGGNYGTQVFESNGDVVGKNGKRKRLPRYMEQPQVVYVPVQLFTFFRGILSMPVPNSPSLY